MAIKQTGQAGTLESNDILIIIAPADVGTGLEIVLNSPVEKQFGTQIKAMIKKVLAEKNVTDAKVNANDRGALDWTIRARVETAVDRAAGQGGL